MLTRSIRRHSTTCIVALLLLLAASPEQTFAQRASPSAQTVVTAAKLSISSATFSRAAVVVLKGGTLTLVNADNISYRIKIGATVVVIPAHGSKTIPLPQRGIFSITCAKAPSLKATLTVK